MMWRELDDDGKEEYYKEAAKVCVCVVGMIDSVDAPLCLDQWPERENQLVR